MKRKILRKFVAALCFVIMAVSNLAISVGAVDTTKAEIEFSLKYLYSLPKKREASFNNFLKFPNIEKLDSKKKCNVKYKGAKVDNG